MLAHRHAQVRRWPLAAAALVALAAAALAAATGVATAHERRDVAGYALTVGFSVEPAYEGQKNGVDLRVARGDQPFEGAEQTLQVEITHIESGVRRTQPLRTIFRDPGHYTSDLVPTAPGAYRLRFFGTLGGVPVDETFESGPGRFNGVEPAADLQFPVRLVEGRELQSGVTGALEAADQAQADAQRARTLAIAGVAAGIAGLLAGGAGLVAARRR